METINLAGIAEPGIGPVTGAAGQRWCACGGPKPNPYSPSRSAAGSDRERRSGKRCLVSGDGRLGVVVSQSW